MCSDSERVAQSRKNFGAFWFLINKILAINLITKQLKKFLVFQNKI